MRRFLLAGALTLAACGGTETVTTTVTQTETATETVTQTETSRRPRP